MPGKKKRTITLTKTKRSGKVVKRKITPKAAARKVKRRGGSLLPNTKNRTLTGIKIDKRKKKKR